MTEEPSAGPSDDEFVEALRTVLTALPGDRPAPDDGPTPRHRISSMRVVTGDDGFDDLEIVVEVGSANGSENGSEAVVTRVLFDRAWREESGLTDPADYAVFVEARWQAGVVREPVDIPAGSLRRSELWQLLEDLLRVDAAGLDRKDHGTWEVVGTDGDPFTVHVTPQQWRGFAAGRAGEALDDLDEVIGSRWDDEEHVVFFRGAFHPSVRPELPPLRSRMSPQ